MATSPEPKRPRMTDPLEPVLTFGSRAASVGLVIGFLIATTSHAAFAGRALLSSADLAQWGMRTRTEIHDFLWQTYDIDVARAKLPEPEPEKPKEPEAEPEEVQPVARAAAPSINEPPPPPPAAAAAGKILDAPAEADEPLDLTGNTFVTGNADTFVGGVTAPAGTGTTATYEKAAVPGGRPGGTGTGPVSVPKKAPEQDLSRAASVASNRSWSCPFPSEADMDQVDYAVVTLVVTVRPDGTPRSVRVLNDPGHGFGRAARLCALSQQYIFPRDRSGEPMTGTTPPIRVTFTR